MGYFIQERFEALEARIKVLEDLAGVTADAEARSHGSWRLHHHRDDEPHRHYGVHLFVDEDCTYDEPPAQDEIKETLGA